MTKVYIVAKGTYSDYHIEAAFSTKEKADQYILDSTDPEEKDIRTRASDYSIKERELDSPYEKKIFKPSFCVVLDLKTGEVLKNKSWESRYEWSPRLGRGNWKIYHPMSYGMVPDYVTGKSYVSKDHAMKLAVEGRQAWLRNNDCEKRYTEI